jgi:hypothetical protein
MLNTYYHALFVRMPTIATKTKTKGNNAEILSKLKKTRESGYRKHVLQLIAHASDTDLTSLRLGGLQNAQEQAQTTRRDKFQFRAVENNVFAVTIVEWLQLFFRHRSCGCVKASLQNGNYVAVLLLNGSFHHIFTIIIINICCKVRKKAACKPIVQKQLLFFNLHLRTTFDLFRIFATNLNEDDRHHTFQFP